MTISLTYAEFKSLHPCGDKQRSVAALFGGARRWGRRQITAREAVEAGVTLDDLVWAASALARTSPGAERRLRLWIADCAARVLRLYESVCPNNSRPRAAIVAARQFARGEIDAAARDAARDAARAAARVAGRDAAWDAARAAARAAAWDAARAAARVAAWDAARGAASAAARAAAWDAARAAAWDAAWDAEEAWQLRRLVERFSEPEPEDWPLDSAPAGEEGEGLN